MAGMKLEQKPELSFEQRTELRITKIERQLKDLKSDVDLAIAYSRAIALELIGAEQLAKLELRARERDMRLAERKAEEELDDNDSG